MFARLNLATRRFSTVNLASVTRAQVLESKDSKWIGDYLKAVTLNPSNEHVANIDEYFRQNFRKLEARQAFEMISQLGDTHEQPAACLDGSFWTWESIEEALMTKTHQFGDDEALQIIRAFSFNYKGSDEFMQELENRVYMAQ